MATGEEKTIYEFPPGYGYPIGGSDLWVLNYMIHDLLSTPATVYITYDMDFLPATAPAAAHITPVHPIWMDVEAHHIYPVFNVKRGSGKDGKFTFPDMAKNPYAGGPPLNEFTVDHPGTLIATAGHLHPGGLYDDLDLIRPGATPSGGAIRGDRSQLGAAVPLQRALLGQARPGLLGLRDDRRRRRTGARRSRPATCCGSAPRTTRSAPRGMRSMGIMVVWEAWNDQHGRQPVHAQARRDGHVTHGHLPREQLLRRHDVRRRQPTASSRPATRSRC